MQVRRLGYELGILYSEDHGRPILTYGDRSVVFCLMLGSRYDGTVFQSARPSLNKEVYTFQWSVTSVFQYSEFRRLAMQLFPKAPDRRRFYPSIELPESLCKELDEKRYLLLDGNMEKAKDSFSFHYWIVDKGPGVHNMCINTYFDALLFLPVRIIVTETGKVLRW